MNPYQSPPKNTPFTKTDAHDPITTLSLCMVGAAVSLYMMCEALEAESYMFLLWNLLCSLLATCFVGISVFWSSDYYMDDKTFRLNQFCNDYDEEWDNFLDEHVWIAQSI